MSTVFENGSVRRGAGGKPVSIAGRQSYPVQWWAGIGVAFLMLQLYVWGSWIFSADFVPTPPSAPLDDGWRTWIKTFEIFCIVASSSTYIWFVVRPLVKGQELNTTSIVIAMSPLLWFQDPLGLYVTQWWTYSTHFTNFGNWVTHVPGAITPNANLVPEPIFAASSMYVWLVGIPFLIIAAGMRAWKRRFPEASALQVFMVGMLLGFVYDFVAEFTACQVGLWSFSGAIQSLSIFGGHWNQFPIYEMFLWGGMAGAAANVLYWTDDKGQTFVERGLDKLQVSRAAKAWLRFLAFLGIFQVLITVIYTMPIQFFAMNGDPMPEDTPAHLRPGVCGPGTEYACTAPGMPINRAGPRADGSPALIVSSEGGIKAIAD